MIRPGDRSARHTFGSDPDAIGGLPRSRGLQDGEVAPSAALETLAHPIWWLAARERLAEMGEGEHARILTRLVAQVEAGWAMALELSRIADTAPSEPPPEPTLAGEVMARLLGFVSSEVVDLFTQMALTCSTMVPARWDADSEYPSPVEVELVGERFSRNVLMVHLACSDPIISDVARETLRRASGDLLGWFPDFSAVAVAAARAGEAD